MPENLKDQMHEATEGLELPWDPPEAIRRRGNRRRLRWRLTAALVAISAFGWGGTVVLGSAATPKIPEPGPDPTASRCVADLTLPESEREVKLRVYHSAIGVATAAAQDFRERGFEVVETAMTVESTGDNAAVIRYGPAEVGDARLVEAYLPPDVIALEFDPGMTGTVDVILGIRYTNLNTQTEMRQRIAMLGRPNLPAGC